MDNGNFIFWDGWQQPQPIGGLESPATAELHHDQRARQRVLRRRAPSSPTAGSSSSAATGRCPPARSASSTPTSSTRPPTPGPGWPTCTRRAGTRRSPSCPTAATSPSAATPPNETTWADTPEVYDPATNTWTLLSKISTSQVHEEEYPFSYLIPNGNVLDHRAVGGRDLRDERRQPDLDPGRRAQRGGQRLVGPVPAGQDPLQRRRRLGDHHLARPGHHGRARHRPRRTPAVAADLADAPPSHVPHADDAGQRPGPRGGRGGHQRSERDHDRRAADRDLGPGQRDVVGGRADRGRPQLPLDRGADARRTGARRRAAATRTAWPTPASTRRRSTRPPYLFNGARPTITAAPSSTRHTARPSRCPRPTPPRSRRSTWSRWAPTPTRST